MNVLISRLLTKKILLDDLSDDIPISDVEIKAHPDEYVISPRIRKRNFICLCI